MGKNLYIAEKPSVAQEFARVLGASGKRMDGYLECEDSIFTWCVGHLVTMSYPEVYDPNLKRWSLDTLPFIPTEWKYEIIDNVKKQFRIVAGLLNREDVDTIYVCTDSGREGEYIYRLVREEAHVSGKTEKRVWIDSQTEEEILRGVREAKDIREYDNLANAAYLRAKDDYLMGINFSRALSLKFGRVLGNAVSKNYETIAVGRVMTCVLGMVVRREREIRDFTVIPFYRVIASVNAGNAVLEAEWKAVEGSRYYNTPALYKENGFLQEETAKDLIRSLENPGPATLTITKIEKKTEKKKPPLLFNLAELQNECSRQFKKSPAETLDIAQELYEKKLTTYPRTDARVLSTAVSKVIAGNLSGLKKVQPLADFANEILQNKAYVGLEKTPYVDDSKITDHYAIIPTGQGISNLNSLSPVARQVYDLICRRFLSIFYPAAEYEKYFVEGVCQNEHFFTNFRFLKKEGYRKVYAELIESEEKENERDGDTEKKQTVSQEVVDSLKKGSVYPISSFRTKEGKTSPPKRYTSGSLILAMENAGQFIEDEELRAQIKGAGIGTSATRGEIINKLEKKCAYLSIAKKTQVVTPTLKGELVFDIVSVSMKQMLNPELTASWEKGLAGVSSGMVLPEEYMEKLDAFVTKRVNVIKQIENPGGIRSVFRKTIEAYH